MTCIDIVAQLRQTYFGHNAIPSPKSKGLLELMWEAMSDATLVILTVAAIISLVFGLTLAKDKGIAWIEGPSSVISGALMRSLNSSPGAAIMVSVATVVVVTAVNDLQKERQFKALQDKQVSLSVHRIHDVLMSFPGSATHRRSDP